MLNKYWNGRASVFETGPLEERVEDRVCKNCDTDIRVDVSYLDHFEVYYECPNCGGCVYDAA